MKSGIQKENTKQRHPRGFTLIELLIAITIIAILAGLLLTGVQSARSAVKKAEVAQEIRNLETALTQFHAEFGMYPPSQITLYSTNDPATGWSSSNAVQSRAIIQKLWPSFDFTLPRPLPSGASSIDLKGAECLVFFLGGIRDDNDNLIGFSKNPRNPFDTTGTNRVGPFHEFNYTRLKENSSGMYEYYDSFADQQNPIWYLSSYDGRGYRTSANTGNNDLPPGMIDCYRQGFSFGIQGGNLVLASDLTPLPDPAPAIPQAWGMKSYQLISPGPDGVYGVGGYFADGMAPPKKPNWISEDDWRDIVWPEFKDKRRFRGGMLAGDEDNITSFSANMK